MKTLWMLQPRKALVPVLTRVPFGRAWSLSALFLLLAAVPAGALQSGDYNYFVNPDNTVTINYYTGSGGTVVVPSTIDEKNVTIIEGHAFYELPLVTRIEIPDTVISIGSEAFYNCANLTAATIGNNVASIGAGAFSKCASLTSVTIPGSVSQIRANTFYSCSKLSVVVLGTGVTNIGDLAFSDCTNLPSISIPNSVTSLGDAAFRYCSRLTSVTLGTHVTSIGESAFNRCTRLASVAIPDSVTSIGNWAFVDCSGLDSVTIGTGVTNIGYSAFKNCYGLASVTIGPNVISFGDYAFSSCSSLPSVTIPNSVTFLGNGAFEACGNLTNVIIGSGVANLGIETFRSCAKLPSVIIPDTVTSIGDVAFDSCSKLNGVVIGTGVTNIGDYAFSYCTGLSEIYFLGNAPYARQNVFQSDNTTVYRLPGASGWPPVPALWAGRPTALWVATPTKIIGVSGNLAFGNVTTGQTASATLSITNSGNETLTVTGLACPTGFSGAWSGPIAAGGSQGVTVTFTPVAAVAYGGIVTVNSDKTSGENTLTASGTGRVMTSGEPYTFTTNNGTITLTGYTGSGGALFLPGTINSLLVTGIGDGAFVACTNLTSVTIPDSVTNIGVAAFIDCTGLTSVSIGKGVTSVGDVAFDNCTNLVSVYFRGNAPHFGEYVFMNVHAPIYYLSKATGWSEIPTFDACPLVLWSPQILPGVNFGVRAGQFGFKITGTSNQLVVVEACTNLANPLWFPVATNALTDGTSAFNDLIWTHYPARFYRLCMP